MELEIRFARLEEALSRLTEAQARTEERVGRLEEAVIRLTEGQQELQTAVARLTEGQRQLMEAQARTEEHLGRLEEAVTRLTEAQVRTEERLGRLEEAQARTERALQQLARQVGGLSETVGGDIEDIAYIVLYDVLQREFGWEVGPLERVFQEWNGELIELNIFGQATDPAQPDRPLWIIGEAKHNLTLKEVERFAQLVDRARQHLTGEIFPVCFCYRTRPEVRERLQELRIRLVFSYGRLV